MDKDECGLYGYCSQFCENSRGSYKCDCASGYKLIEGKKCIADEKAFIYFVHHTEVFRINPEGRSEVR